MSGSATDRSSEGVQAEDRSSEPHEGFHLSTVIDAADQDWIKQRQVLTYPSAPQAYRSEAACHAAGISHRQLDYWARTGLVKPSVRFGQPGKHNLYSFRDILL